MFNGWREALSDFAGWLEVRVAKSTGELVSIRPTSPDDSDDTLTHRILQLQGLVEELNEDLRASTEILRERMDVRGTKQYISTSDDTGRESPMVAQVKESGIRYDHDKLDAIIERELIPEDKLVFAGALVPAHEKTVVVPRKWYIKPLREFARRYPEVNSIIDEARTVGRSRIVVD